MSEGRLFGSVVRALDFYPGRLGLKPTIDGDVVREEREKLRRMKEKVNHSADTLFKK